MKAMQAILLLAALVFLWRLFFIASAFTPAEKRRPCSFGEAKRLGTRLLAIAEAERCRAWKEDSLASRQAAWLKAKAEYALHKSGILKANKPIEDEKCFLLEDTYAMLLRAMHQSRCGVKDIQEEAGSRLRSYISDIDQSFQTYSISIPANYNPAVKYPLIVSMHGHGWYAPFQGHPAPRYAGAFCLSPQGRGATDYKDIGEEDVMAAIAQVKRDFSIDENRIYLTGSSMGGTGAFHIATRYCDNFAAIFPIVGNADNEAWTKAWGWNRRFPGRNDTLRKWLQDGHTARAFAENLLSIPSYIIAGSADTVVPPDHSRNMVRILRKYKANVEYREYPGCGHGGFPQDALSQGLAWTCSWERNPHPSHLYWKADQLKYGKFHWMKMEQMEMPLKTAGFIADVNRQQQLNIRTSNLLALSFQRPKELFPNMTGRMSLLINGKEITLDNLPTDEDSWICLRNDPNHGWCDARLLPPGGLMKRKDLEGPINEVLNSPFMLVVGTSAPDKEMNNAWKREAQKFAEEWTRRNGQPCLMKLDRDCTLQDMQSRSLILFGGAKDNLTSALIEPNIPMADVMANLPMKDLDPQDGDNPIEADDLGSLVLYPNVEFAPDKLVVILAANSPVAAHQLWGRFGTWFNWGVFDCKKYFDYAVFDARTSSPETFPLLGWFGTDWQVESGRYFLGNEELRKAAVPMQYPRLQEVPEDCEPLYLSDLLPSHIDQMRGALGFGRGFFGESLASEHSLGMRAPCSIEYNLKGNYRRFTSKVTLLNSPETEMCFAREKGEEVKFQVKGDGRLLAEVTVNWRKPEAEIDASVLGIKKLKLVAFPSAGPSWLHSGSAWIEPQVK